MSLGAAASRLSSFRSGIEGSVTGLFFVVVGLACAVGGAVVKKPPVGSLLFGPPSWRRAEMIILGTALAIVGTLGLVGVARL
jgi:hypothetical protein